MGAKSQSNKIGGIGSSSSRPNSLNIKVKEEPTYFQQGPSEEYLQPSEEYVYPCDDREFSGYESEFDQLTGESDYDEPQIDQSEQEDQGIYYQHGMNQRQQSFYSQRPPFRCSGRGGYSQRPVSPRATDYFEPVQKQLEDERSKWTYAVSHMQGYHSPCEGLQIQQVFWSFI